MQESYLISVALKSTIVLGAGFLCLRSRSAAARHLACLAALACAATVPLLALWSPRWSMVLSVAAGPNSTQAGVASVDWNWPAILSILWALGAAALLIRAAGGWVLLLRARRESVHFEHTEPAEIRIGRVSTPLTCGVFRPMILLPELAREWNAARLRAVLLHESAHLKRHDCLAKYIAQASRALLWWNPLAWILAARMNQEQELACDDAVLAAGVSADVYANVLLDTARECSAPLLLACSMGCAMTAGGVLEQRLKRLFERKETAVSPAWKKAIAIPALLVLITGVSCAEKIYKMGPGIVPPKLLQKTDPNYTDDARAKKLAGTVDLSLVVGVDQIAHDIKVTKSLDPGLDANAVAAIKNWKFQPGTKNGKPVPVRAHVQVNFQLQ